MSGAVMSFDAILLAGGGGRRLGGVDKASLEVGGTSLLERALRAVSKAGRVVVVGPRRSASTEVLWTREQPAGGGPVAAVAAGLQLVERQVLVVLAVDYPFVTPRVIESLLAAVADHDGAVLADGGRRHYVVGAFATDALRRVLGRAETLAHASMKRTLDPLDLAEVLNEAAAFDVDSPEDLARARRLAAG
ncbi:MAG: molybdenum cofactor guanylyltransferase [Actinomycetota bacterium]